MIWGNVITERKVERERENFVFTVLISLDDAAACWCCCCWWWCWICSIGDVCTSLLLRGSGLCCVWDQSSKSFLRISGEGFDWRPYEMERYCSYKANSSESSILDAPLIENSGALDAAAVAVVDEAPIGRFDETGVFSSDDAGTGFLSGVASKRDGRVVIADGSTVTLTRGVETSDGDGDGVVVDEDARLPATAIGLDIGFKLHLII